MITRWSDHPVTQRLMYTLKDCIYADKEMLLSSILDKAWNNPADSAPLHYQLKGQIKAFEKILDPKDFLLTEEEINNDRPI